MKARNYTIDFLKIIATTFIVFHHFQQVTNTQFERFNFDGGNLYFGYLVEFFFIVSGYLMAHNKERKKRTNSEDFLLRIERLFPMILIINTVCLLAAGIYKVCLGEWWLGVPHGIWSIFLSFTLLFQGGPFGDQMGLNNPTWYVCVLLECYILYYLIYKLFPERNLSRFISYCFITLLAAGMYTYHVNFPFFTQQSTRGYTAFFVGVILYHVIQYLPKKAVHIPSLLLLLTIAVSYFIWPELIDNQWAIATFLFFPSVFVFCMSNSTIQKILCFFPFLETGGKASFHVYLWHTPVFLIGDLIIRLCSKTMEYTTGTMLLTALCLWVWGILSYYFIEKPVSRAIASRHEAIMSRISQLKKQP